MTGNRSSAIARVNPAASQKAGRRRARRVGPRADLRVGLDRREATRREVVADGLDQAQRRGPRRAPPRRGDAGDDGRQRRGRQPRIEVARLLCPRIGGQRTELAVRGRRRRRVRGPSRSCRRRRGRGRATAACAGRRARRPGALASSARTGSGRPGLVVVEERVVDGVAVRGRTGSRPPTPRGPRGTGCPGPAGRARSGAGVGSFQPGQPGRLRAARGVLPVVARPVVEAGVGARRDPCRIRPRRPRQRCGSSPRF